MKRIWPIIAVNDVRASSAWYQTLLGCANNHYDSADFDQILDADGTILLCLHRWDDDQHPSLMTSQPGAPGKGLLLFFCVDDFEAATARARSLVAQLDEEPHLNPNTRALEFSLRDPDGYFVTVSAFGADPTGGPSAGEAG